MSKKLRANREAGPLVAKREAFTGSSLRGETYQRGVAPFLSVRDTWMDEFETDMYAKVRDRVTYIVWSFYTPIAYYVEGSGWYMVALSFSPHTSRHRGHALSHVTGHTSVLTGKRGDWTVTCHEPGCWGQRHFTREADARRVNALHR